MNTCGRCGIDTSNNGWCQDCIDVERPSKRLVSRQRVSGRLRLPDPEPLGWPKLFQGMRNGTGARGKVTRQLRRDYQVVAVEMRREGYTIAQIAGCIGVGTRTVDRMLNDNYVA